MQMCLIDTSFSGSRFILENWHDNPPTNSQFEGFDLRDIPMIEGKRMFNVLALYSILDAISRENTNVKYIELMPSDKIPLGFENTSRKRNDYTWIRLHTGTAVMF
jgi:hypothetical protein